MIFLDVAGMIKDSIVDRSKNHTHFKEGNFDYSHMNDFKNLSSSPTAARYWFPDYPELPEPVTMTEGTARASYPHTNKLLMCVSTTESKLQTAWRHFFILYSCKSFLIYFFKSL